MELNPLILLAAHLYITTGLEPQQPVFGFDETVILLGRAMDLYPDDYDGPKISRVNVRQIYEYTDGAPPLSSAVMLPSPDFIQEQINFAYYHGQYLANKAKMEPHNAHLYFFYANKVERYRVALNDLANAKRFYRDRADFWGHVYVRFYMKEAEPVLGPAIRDGIVPSITEFGLFRRVP